MRYELGMIDRYAIAVTGSVMENASFFKATLDEQADAEKLLAAVKTALQYHPLFKCKMCYDKRYYLEEIENEEIILFHTDTENRPKEFGKNTNGYLFQICYYENTVSLEWCHAVTDGRGAIRFFSDILSAYFGLQMPKIPAKFPLELGLESIYDKSVKPLGQIKQPAGFNAKDLAVIPNGYKCTSHVLKVPAAEVMRVAKKIDATPAAILVPLFCRAVRAHLPEDAKNRNVSCSIVVDCRAPSKLETMHNFVGTKLITYQDKFDDFDLPKLSTIYRGILDLFVQPENIIAAATNFMDDTGFLYTMRPLALQKIVIKTVSKIVKRRMNNFAFTYLGRVPFPEEVKSRLLDFNFRSWPDIGDCVIAAVDLNGTLIIDVCENYADKGIVSTFIDICKKYGMNIEDTGSNTFEQANLRF